MRGLATLVVAGRAEWAGCVVRVVGAACAIAIGALAMSARVSRRERCVGIEGITK